MLENTITLCDLCHALLHPHLWPSWFPQVRSNDEWLRTKAIEKLREVKEEFQWFCRLPADERLRVQRQIWTMFGVHLGAKDMPQMWPPVPSGAE